MALSFCALLTLAGCESMSGDKDDNGEGAPVEDVSGQGAGDDGSASTSAAMGSSSWTRESLDDPDSPLYNKVIYFAFDQSGIQPEYQEILRSHAAFLSNNPDIHITIEGHTDEKGTREYNIALGERRAQAVRTFLRLEGVRMDQMSTVSYGEEQPAALGLDEASMAANRRAVLVY